MRSKNSKPEEIRRSNIMAAKALSDAIRTSLGPRGMDKMIQDAKGEVTITNDGATILNQMNVVHPAARMLVELSKAQDIEAGDGKFGSLEKLPPALRHDRLTGLAYHFTLLYRNNLRLCDGGQSAGRG